MVESTDMENPELGKPDRFTPSWPPRQGDRAAAPNIFTKVSDKFKKVSWPPTTDDGPGEIAPPPSGIQLLEDIPLNDTAIRPVGTYKAAPTAYAEDPENLPQSWPPPENPNIDERVIYDASRPKRVHRDYAVHFNKNAAPPVQASYQIPPGTLHVISKRGVLSYDTPDLGGARMAPSDKK